MWILGADAGKGALLGVKFPTTKFGLVLLANSWVFLYLWINGGSPEVEVSTQLPDAPYCATARVKSGMVPDFVPDNTRRCVRTVALCTDGSGSIHGLAESTGRKVAGPLRNTVHAYPAMAGVNSPLGSRRFPDFGSGRAPPQTGEVGPSTFLWTASPWSSSPWGGISVLTFNTARHVSDNGPVRYSTGSPRNAPARRTAG